MINRDDLQVTHQFDQFFAQAMDMAAKVGQWLDKAAREKAGAENRQQLELVLDVLRNLESQAREQVPEMMRACQDQINSALDQISDTFRAAESLAESGSVSMDSTKAPRPVDLQPAVEMAPGEKVAVAPRPDLLDGSQLRNILSNFFTPASGQGFAPARTSGMIWENWPPYSDGPASPGDEVGENEGEFQAGESP
jgi:hypothetical protein